MATEPKTLTNRERDVVLIGLAKLIESYGLTKSRSSDNTLLEDTYEKLIQEARDVSQKIKGH